MRSMVLMYVRQRCVSDTNFQHVVQSPLGRAASASKDVYFASVVLRLTFSSGGFERKDCIGGI